MELDERNGDDIGASERASATRDGSRQYSNEQHNCLLKKGILGRWFLVNPDDEHLGWSGSRWVPIDDLCMPTGDVQVSNFDSVTDAALHAARAHGFFVVGIKDDAFAPIDNGPNDGS